MQKCQSFEDVFDTISEFDETINEVLCQLRTLRTKDDEVCILTGAGVTIFVSKRCGLLLILTNLYLLLTGWLQLIWDFLVTFPSWLSHFILWFTNWWNPYKSKQYEYCWLESISLDYYLLQLIFYLKSPVTFILCKYVDMSIYIYLNLFTN